MNREKVLELAREADVWVADQPPYQEQLERFAALIEAEVRVDAEPVARLRFYKGEVVVTKDYETVERNGEFDVYTHPAPAVVRQLVDALRMVMDDSDALDGRPRTYECVQEALAAVKEVGL